MNQYIGQINIEGVDKGQLGSPDPWVTNYRQYIGSIVATLIELVKTVWVEFVVSNIQDVPGLDTGETSI